MGSFFAPPTTMACRRLCISLQGGIDPNAGRAKPMKARDLGGCAKGPKKKEKRTLAVTTPEQTRTACKSVSNT